MPRRVIIRWVLVLVLLVFTGLSLLIMVRKNPDGVLRVSFLDIGQGDAIFIEAANRNQVLIDGGSGRQVLRALGGVMPFYDRTIDLVIGTHTDADHIGGLAFIFERFDVLGIMDNGIKEDSNDYRFFERYAATETSAQRLEARVGDKIKLDEGVELEILYPTGGRVSDNTNDNSIVARLTYGETEFLLTADAPSEVEDVLARRYGANLTSDVLKLGHHGSNTSSSNYLLAAVQPEYAVISAGRDNRYGHPHQEVLDRLKKLSIPYINTADVGTITFESDGLSVSCRKCISRQAE